MKRELSKITQDLEQGTITEDKARTLLLGLLGVSKSFSWDEVEEFGRNAFYKGREFSGLKDPNNGIPYFKRPTYNGYLREINAD